MIESSQAKIYIKIKKIELSQIKLYIKNFNSYYKFLT